MRCALDWSSALPVSRVSPTLTVSFTDLRDIGSAPSEPSTIDSATTTEIERRERISCASAFAWTECDALACVDEPLVDPSCVVIPERTGHAASLASALLIGPLPAFPCVIVPPPEISAGLVRRGAFCSR